MGKSIFQKSDIDFMIENANQMSFEEIGEKLGYTRKQITSKMNQLGVFRRRRFDGSYFEKIDTNIKAYILGFVYADGWVCCNP